MTTTAIKGRLPRGVKNHNPGNLRIGAPWQGLAAEQTDSDFCCFKDPTWGIRALAATLITYYDKHHIDNIEGVINRWAPTNENDTRAYINQVVASTGFASWNTLDLHSYADIRPLVEAIIRHENGRGPLSTSNTWYDSATIDAGLQRAGIVKIHMAVAAVPVTKETVAASGTAGLGVAQLADVAPQVMTALDTSSGDLSSGSWVRIALGVSTIILAGFIAYSQVKKHQSGVVA